MIDHFYYVGIEFSLKCKGNLHARMPLMIGRAPNELIKIINLEVKCFFFAVAVQETHSDTIYQFEYRLKLLTYQISIWHIFEMLRSSRYWIFFLKIKGQKENPCVVPITSFLSYRYVK